MALTLPANAKVNLGLHITGRRDDGYHLLHTLYQEISFGDTLTLSEGSSGSVTMRVSGPAAEGVPTGGDNLCVRAARLLQARLRTRRGVHILLQKHIPAGSGLGGGSSDAGAVLRGLNRYWQAGLTPAELEALAVELGADVPFFIRGGLQLGAGIGDDLTPLSQQLAYALVLVIPPFSVDTAWAYGQLAARESFSAPPAFDQLLAQTPIPWDRFSNDFEGVVFPRYRRLAEIKRELRELGAVYAGLSGSGSAVFGLFEEAPGDKAHYQRWPDCQVVNANPLQSTA
ncbi:MAG: 4-(cytidine 5'-diphospho)-2-C-methyl-D-erythritol kinase [Candidatus Marinimicrobia bacterium]|nr:4-(cytidine 5'-diphospho)-2-C-methyl-D-erythritol kinase [Candidatus Neomarinimicrobiota bacterium]